MTLVYPSGPESLKIKLNYVEKLKASLQYLLTYWSGHTGRELSLEMLTFVEGLVHSDPRLWYISALNRHFAELAQRGGANEVQTYLEDLEHVVRAESPDPLRLVENTVNAKGVACSSLTKLPHGSGHFILALNDMSLQQRDLFCAYATENSGLSEAEIEPMAPSELEHTASLLASAYSILARDLPAFAEEYRIFVNSVLIYRSSTLASGTSFSLCGSIYVHSYPDDDEKNIFVVLDRLIHETAHLYLHYQSMDEEFLTNDINECRPTPFRDEDRPLIGIFHAHFVLYRLLQALSQSSLQDHFELNLISRTREKYRQAFIQTTDVLSAYGKFTPAGEEIFQQTLCETSL